LKKKHKFILSYNGGTSRGETLAINIGKDEALLRFFQPRISSRVKKNVPAETVVEDSVVCWVGLIYNLLKKTLCAKPTKRYYIDRFTDKRVAQRLNKEGTVFLGQAGISLCSLRKARHFGSFVILDRTNTHILHQNQVWAKLLQARKISWKPSSPRVTNVHLDEYHEADAILVLSRFVRDTFVNYGVPQEKIFVCPSGIDSEKFTPSPQQKSEKAILFCGSISLKKGCHLLVELARRLQLSGAEVWLAGTVSPEMKKILGTRPANCRILPFHSQDALPDLYRKARCFALPSFEEGLPKVVLEAMACGLPVVTTPEAAAKEVVEDGVTGFAINSSDPEQLFQKCRLLLEKPELARTMGFAARKKVETTFTELHYYQRFRKIMETLLGNLKN